jgi:RHS repeat-associated protein
MHRSARRLTFARKRYVRLLRSCLPVRTGGQNPALRGSRLVTDSSGNIAAQLGHFPFGESWYNSTNDKLLFTSYDRDSATGNDYAMARNYVSRLARMASPDPIAGSVLNPQSLNRYAYVANDPADLTDPSGLVVGCSTARNETDDSSAPSDSGGVGMLPNEEMAPPDPQGGCPGSHFPPGGGLSVDWTDVTDNSGMGISAFGGAIIFGRQGFGGEDGGWAWIFALLSSPASGPSWDQGAYNLGGTHQPAEPPGYKQCVIEALLEVIAHGEGMDNEPNDGYGTNVFGTVTAAPPALGALVGKRNIFIRNPEELPGHPHLYVGEVNSTAFGRYQINGPTAAQFGITDFSRNGQDAGATAIMNYYDAVQPALHGNFQQAMWNAGVPWASMPDSPWPQRHITMGDASQTFQNALNTLPDCL